MLLCTLHSNTDINPIYVRVFVLQMQKKRANICKSTEYVLIQKHNRAQTSQIFCDETNVASLGMGGLNMTQQSKASVPTGVSAVSLNMLLQSCGYTRICFQTPVISLISGVVPPSLSSQTWTLGEESEER